MNVVLITIHINIIKHLFKKLILIIRNLYIEKSSNIMESTFVMNDDTTIVSRICRKIVLKKYKKIISK